MKIFSNYLRKYFLNNQKIKTYFIIKQCLKNNYFYVTQYTNLRNLVLK